MQHINSNLTSSINSLGALWHTSLSWFQLPACNMRITSKLVAIRISDIKEVMCSEHFKLLYKHYGNDNDDEDHKLVELSLCLLKKKTSEVAAHSIPMVTSELLKDMPLI